MEDMAGCDCFRFECMIEQIPRQGGGLANAVTLPTAPYGVLKLPKKLDRPVWGPKGRLGLTETTTALIWVIHDA